jgi:hypothetical protein
MLRFRRRRKKGRKKRGPAVRSVRPWENQEAFQNRWTLLQQRCTDRASQARLAHLLKRLGGIDRGARESALAELDLAGRLARAGCSVVFLPESRSRSADLECRLGTSRFYVEITALVGSRRPKGRYSAPVTDKSPGRENHDEQPVLIHRLLARIAQKARQLSDYREAMILVIIVPRAEESSREIDLKHLSGAITLLLLAHVHVSAVMLALWDVPTAPSRSGVRLGNVHIVERSKQQRTHPCVRLLVLNPSASCRLNPEAIEIMKGLL